MSSAMDTASRLNGWWGWRQPPPPKTPRAAQPAAASAAPAAPSAEKPAVPSAPPAPVASNAEQPTVKPPKPPPAPPPSREVRAQSLQLVWGPSEVAPGGKPAHLALGEILDLEPKSHVIEIGCGLGGFARVAATNFNAEVTATDFDPMLVKIAQGLPQNPAVKFVASTRAPFSIDARAAERIVARSVIGDGDAAAMLQGLKGLLSTGGRIVLLEFCCASDDQATRKKLAQYGVKAANLESILAAAETAGLTVVSTENGTQSLINTIVAGWTKLEPKIAAGSLPPSVVTVLSEEAVKWAQLSAALTKHGARFHTIVLDAAPVETGANDQLPKSLLAKFGLGGLAGPIVGKMGKLFRRR